MWLSSCMGRTSLPPLARGSIVRERSALFSTYGCAFAVPADARSALFNTVKVPSSNFVPRSCLCDVYFYTFHGGFCGYPHGAFCSMPGTQRPSCRAPLEPIIDELGAPN